MERVVYADIYFLINFSMDFLCFYILCRLLSRRMSLGRCVLASAMGGVYANLILFCGTRGLTELILDLGFAAVMCAAAFYKKGRGRQVPGDAVIYSAVSMVLGGFMTALFNLWNSLEIFVPAEDEIPNDPPAVWGVALLAAVGALISLYGGGLFKKRLSLKEAAVVIEHGGKSVRLRGLVDNGNMLREPISGKPCIVVDREAAAALLPDELIKLLRGGGAVEDYLAGGGSGFRLIPIKTAAGSSMTLGFIPDRAIIIAEEEKGTGEAVPSAKEADAVIALGNLGEGTAICRDRRINALLPAALML